MRRQRRETQKRQETTISLCPPWTRQRLPSNALGQKKKNLSPLSSVQEEREPKRLVDAGKTAMYSAAEKSIRQSVMAGTFAPLYRNACYLRAFRKISFVPLSSATPCSTLHEAIERFDSVRGGNVLDQRFNRTRMYMYSSSVHDCELLIR